MPGPASPLDRGAPAAVVVGVGASRGCPADELLTLVDATLAEAGVDRSAVALVTSADVKADEPAVVALAATLGAPTRFASAGALAAVPVPTPSAVVAAHVGTPSVAEASALLGAAGGPDDRADAATARLLVPKRRSAHATCAVAAPPLRPTDAAPSTPSRVPLP